MRSWGVLVFFSIAGIDEYNQQSYVAEKLFPGKLAADRDIENCHPRDGDQPLPGAEKNSSSGKSENCRILF
jgi:hypothetical protein